jgi:hypothetical protein
LTGCRTPDWMKGMHISLKNSTRWLPKKLGIATKIIAALAHKYWTISQKHQKFPDCQSP